MVAIFNLEALIKFVEDFQKLVSNRVKGNEKLVTLKGIKRSIRNFDVAFQNATSQKMLQKGKLITSAELGIDLLLFTWFIVVDRFI